jgi:hypothetical protein
LNPSIDKNCTNLWLDTAYCVQAVGDINTYPNYPYSSSAVYTLTSSAYVTTSSVSTSTVPSATPYVRPPHAPGTKADCEGYVDYIPVTPFQDQSQSENVRLVTEQMNSCEFASSGYPVSYDDFLEWNPSLASIEPCYLQANYSYCAVDNISSYSECDVLGLLSAISTESVMGKADEASSRDSELRHMSFRRRPIPGYNFYLRMFHSHHRVRYKE